jgi:hypothetical protein
MGKSKDFSINVRIIHTSQIFEHLGSALKPGSKVTAYCHIPGAYCAQLLFDGNWLSENLLKDGIFKR